MQNIKTPQEVDLLERVFAQLRDERFWPRRAPEATEQNAAVEQKA